MLLRQRQWRLQQLWRLRWPLLVLRPLAVVMVAAVLLSLFVLAAVVLPPPLLLLRWLWQQWRAPIVRQQGDVGVAPPAEARRRWCGLTPRVRGSLLGMAGQHGLLAQGCCLHLWLRGPVGKSAQPQPRMLQLVFRVGLPRGHIHIPVHRHVVVIEVGQVWVRVQEQARIFCSCAAMAALLLCCWVLRSCGMAGWRKLLHNVLGKVGDGGSVDPCRIHGHGDCMDP